MKKLFIFGLGYSAGYVAAQAIAGGWRVAGTTRDAARAEHLSRLGMECMLFDALDPASLRGVDAILVSIPTAEGVGDPVLARYREAVASAGVPWIGYFSTTGVYGDWDGAWVDETCEARCGNPRLERRVRAEDQWRELGAHVFRLAGIYGPGRSVVDDVLAGTARRIDKPGQVFSRIHVEDIAGVVRASLRRPTPGEIYNVCDDEPAPAHEVVTYTCELLGKPLPELVNWRQAGLSAMGLEFYSANRRVSNQKVRDVLEYDFVYPTYREGIKALVAAPQEA